jgi:DNA-binding transcriptional ArsR family regulator
MSSGSNTATKPSTAAAEKVLEAKWGKTLIAAGWTALPDVVFQYQKALKLKPLDVTILLHLASYWWKPGENPWPAKGTIAEAIDVDPRTVQRHIEAMEKKGYVKRIQRRASEGDNLSNEYDLRGMIKAATKYAEEKIVIKAKRQAEDESRRTTPATFALIAGSKKA